MGPVKDPLILGSPESRAQTTVLVLLLNRQCNPRKVEGRGPRESQAGREPGSTCAITLTSKHDGLFSPTEHSLKSYIVHISG